MIVAVSGSAVLMVPKDPGSDSAGTQTSETAPVTPGGPVAAAPSAVPGAVPPVIVGERPIDDPANILDPLLGTVVDTVGGVVGGVVDGVGGVVDDVEDGVLDPVLEAVAPTVHADINITGSGTPGAEVVASVDGLVYARTTVGGNGLFSLTLTGLPVEISTVDLKQSCNGLLGCLLGGLTDLLGGVSVNGDVLVRLLG